MKKNKIPRLFTIDPDVYNDFGVICVILGISRSVMINELMRNFTIINKADAIMKLNPTIKKNVNK